MTNVISILTTAYRIDCIIIPIVYEELKLQRKSEIGPLRRDYSENENADLEYSL